MDKTIQSRNAISKKKNLLLIDNASSYKLEENEILNRIDTFDAYNDFGTEIPLLNIFNAITWTAEVLETTGIPNDNEIISSILEVPEVEKEINNAISP
ncbi:9124_t:CDS:2 [Diversispora eburnea]|uniref:9124_t:CDS:1 n=1 Tax=Diversispora eburnea TaxID=1213867 RepID=A0A9N8YZS0_9GLOM|nr:9124_t:CDS:2 [Diversispora eburnea]